MKRVDVYGCCLALLVLLPALSQTQSSSDKSQTSTPQTSAPLPVAGQKLAEIVSQERAATFHVNVKLVTAKVVVRDRQGHAIGDLHKEDFQIFDNGKPQEITQFSVEHAGARFAMSQKPVIAPSTNPVEKTSGAKATAPPSPPEQYIAYLFDDAHLKFEDAIRTREAAERSIGTLPLTARFAIFTTSGHTSLDFTDDKTRASAALKKIEGRATADEALKCPDLNLYMADLIVNQHNEEALATAVNEVKTSPASTHSGRLGCYTGTNPEAFVERAARQVLATGEQEIRGVTEAIRKVVLRLALMPGSRSVALVSPGFNTPGLAQYDINEVIEIALRAQVIIGTLDARGLYVTPGVITDSSKGFGAGTDPNVISVQGSPTGAGFTPSSRPLLDQLGADRQKDVMANLAYSTGGKFFFNNNDMDEGFRRLAEPPEFTYVLGYVPQNLKPDGSYHKLKVRLRTGGNFELQAREGYFAPKSFADPAQQAKVELQQLEFLPDELQDLPVELHTQFYMAAHDSAKLSVLAHVDVKRLALKRVADRNCDVLTVVSLVFDRNGNFLQGTEKELDLRLTDDTLEHKLAAGMTVKTSFDVQPGNYLVRIVVRDGEVGQCLLRMHPLKLRMLPFRQRRRPQPHLRHNRRKIHPIRNLWRPTRKLTVMLGQKPSHALMTHYPWLGRSQARLRHAVYS